MAAACPTAALAGNGEDDAKAPKASASQLPNIYVDMRTNYFTVPAGTLNIGFGNSLSLPSLSSLSSVSGQGASIDLPLTVDFNERFSVFGGITASTSKTDLTPWSSLAVATWNVGIQADIIEQNGGPLPTVTVLSTLTKSATEGPLSTTNLTTVTEAAYAFDTDETRALPGRPQPAHEGRVRGLGGEEVLGAGSGIAHRRGGCGWERRNI